MITIFDSYDPLVTISDFSTRDSRKGCKHSVKPLECTFIRKGNTYSIVSAECHDFTEKQRYCCFQSENKREMSGNLREKET